MLALTVMEYGLAGLTAVIAVPGAVAEEWSGFDQGRFRPDGGIDGRKRFVPEVNGSSKPSAGMVTCTLSAGER